MKRHLTFTVLPIQDKAKSMWLWKTCSWCSAIHERYWTARNGRGNSHIIPLNEWQIYFFFLNYWRANVVTVRYYYPIPRIDGCINLFRNSLIFFTNHDTCVYCQAWIDCTGHEKSSVNSNHGMSRFSEMSFCIVWHTGAFQRAMDVTL